MSLTADEIKELVAQGENERLEFKRSINPAILSKNLSAFSNSGGGTLIIGVDEDPRRYDHPTVVGAEPSEVQKAHEHVVEKVGDGSHVEFSTVNVDGKSVAVIEVEPTEEVLFADSGAYVRLGSSTRPMPPSQITHALQKDGRPNSKQVERLGKAVAEQTEMIEDLQEQLETANSYRRKAMDYLIGGGVGAVLGFLLSLLA